MVSYREMIARHRAERDELRARHAAERAAIAKLRVPSTRLVPVAPLRDAVRTAISQSGGDPYARQGRQIRSDESLTWSEIARRVYPDARSDRTSAIQRAVGHAPYETGKPCAVRIDRDLAARIARAVGLDPVDVDL